MGVGRRKEPEERSRNPILVSDKRKQLLERKKAEYHAEDFDEVIDKLIRDADEKDSDKDPNFFQL